MHFSTRIRYNLPLNFDDIALNRENKCLLEAITLNKNDSQHPDPNVSKAVVSRLSLYLRELQHLMLEGKTTISSTRLGRLLGLTASQVRKDFANFGQFGYPGIGYRCEELINEIKRILGTDRVWPIAIVGCGNLGQALLGYKGFQKQGFSLRAAFDVDPQLIGSQFHGLSVLHLDSMPEVVLRESIQMAILAVPAQAAPDVAEALVKSGISGVLNFAPVTLNLPKSVSVIGVDLAIELEQLAFAVVRKSEK